MSAAWTKKVEISDEMSIEDLRRACVEEKREQTNLILRERHAILKALYRAIKGKGKAYDFQGGLATHMDDNEAEWLAFLRKHGDLQHLDEIDIDFPKPVSPAIPSTPTASTSARPRDAMDVDEAPSTSKATATPQIAMTPAPTASETPATSAIPAVVPAEAKPALAPPSSAPPTQAALPSSGAASSSTSTSGAAPQQAPPTTPVPSPPTASPSNASPKSPNTLAIPVTALSESYASNLPDLPFEAYKTKFAHVSRRKGKEKAATSSGGPDLYKMQIKAQHTGIKNFIGRGKRVHNALSTHDWMVGLEEIRSVRAFERIDQLKNEKAWSFRQPKRQRAGFVTKAHWDHVIDEMRWMQTDFRQETRWKVAAAYEIARMVKKWHRAGSNEARAAMCVKTRPPTIVDESEVPTLESLKERASPPPSGAAEAADDRGEAMDVDAEGEEDVEVEVKNENAQEGAQETAKTSTDGAHTTQKKPAATSGTNTNSAAAPGLSMQEMIALRASFFDMPQSQCLFGDEYLLDIDMEQAIGLFPDLPLYSDFVLPGDLGSDKRIEDSSAWSGRIANMSRLLEQKPWLVSTIDPARFCSKDSWAPETASQLDDNKPSSSALAAEQPSTSLPAGSLLFAPRKGREAPAAEILVPPPSVPNPEERACSIYWSSEDDQLLLSLQAKHGMNWSLIAHLFNHSVARPASDFRLPWDVYDRWNRLVGPGSKEVLKDGTEIKIPLPTYVPPAQTLNNFEGSKKRLRHLAMFEAMRKVQKKREATAAKQPPSGPPRKINMSMHESHNLPARPFYSPMDWTAIKLEQDQAKARLRQEQQQLALQHQRQQQAAVAAQVQLQQHQINNGKMPGTSVSPQPSGGASPAVRYAQVPGASGGQPAISPGPNGSRYPQPIPQGFPIQQGRMSLPLQGPPSSAAASAARLVPSPSTPGAVSPLPLPNGTSPRVASAALPMAGTPPLGQQGAGGASRLPVVPGPPAPPSAGPVMNAGPPQGPGGVPLRPSSSSGLAGQGQQQQQQQQQQSQQQQQQIVHQSPQQQAQQLVPGPGGASISPEQLQLYHQRQQQLMVLQMQRAAQAQQQQQSQQARAGSNGSPAMAARQVGNGGGRSATPQSQPGQE